MLTVEQVFEKWITMDELLDDLYRIRDEFTVGDYENRDGWRAIGSGLYSVVLTHELYRDSVFKISGTCGWMLGHSNGKKDPWQLYIRACEEARAQYGCYEGLPEIDAVLSQGNFVFAKMPRLLHPGVLQQNGEDTTEYNVQARALASQFTTAWYDLSDGDPSNPFHHVVQRMRGLAEPVYLRSMHPDLHSGNILARFTGRGMYRPIMNDPLS